MTRRAGGDDVYVAHHRPTGGPVVPDAPECGRSGAPPHHDGPLGLGQLRHDGALAGLPQRALTAWAGAADYFAQNRPEFKRHIIQYYEFLREQDVALTHALVNLQRRRTPAAVDTLSEDVALTVVRETDAGIIVRGSRLLATTGPIADELAVYHAGNHRVGADAQRQAFAFAIPCDTPGLTFLCREL